jgi:hypothetical protein
LASNLVSAAMPVGTSALITALALATSALRVAAGLNVVETSAVIDGTARLETGATWRLSVLPGPKATSQTAAQAGSTATCQGIAIVANRRGSMCSGL